MRLRLYVLPVSVLVLGLFLAQAAFSDSITIFNTGESNQGTALAFGTVDPHYNLTSAPPGVGLTAFAASPDPAWIAGDSNADWISPGGDGSTSWPVGNYTYETTFTVTGNPNSAELSGNWTSDNDACIDLNGVNTGICTTFAGFGSLHAFDITSGFKSGLNTLDFVVDNGGFSPTGVLVEFAPTSQPTPEPGSLVLMGIGLLALVAAFCGRLKGGLTPTV